MRDGTVEGGGAETAGGFRAEDVSFGTDAPVPIIAKCQGRTDNKTAMQKEYVLNHLNFQQVKTETQTQLTVLHQFPLSIYLPRH